MYTNTQKYILVFKKFITAVHVVATYLPSLVLYNVCMEYEFWEYIDSISKYNKFIATIKSIGFISIMYTAIEKKTKSFVKNSSFRLMIKFSNVNTPLLISNAIYLDCLSFVRVKASFTV